jgi:hypothetical protein
LITVTGTTFYQIYSDFIPRVVFVSLYAVLSKSNLKHSSKS